jgi:uncharacterized protein YjbI with pentapeptide repeats
MNLPHVAFLSTGLIVGVIVGLALLLAAGWFWWAWPKREIERLRPMIFDSAARANAEDNIRKTISQVLSSVIVLIAAGVAATVGYLQLLSQQQASRDLLISNQVSKGFELLGSGKSEVRLGGIYALEGVMNTSEQYYQPVLETLSAFVRDLTVSKTGEAPPAIDVQVALTVIGRRAAGTTKGPDLTNARIPHARLTSADLRGATLVGADLSEAILIHADLFQAVLVDANLRGASLASANLRQALLSRANLTEALLFFADLSEANLGPSEIDVTGISMFKVIRLSGANLTDARLSGANLANAHLNNANLTRADLEGVKNLTQKQLDQACGTNAKLDPPLEFHDKPCPY